VADQRSQPRLSLCQEYRVRDPSFQHDCDVRFVPKADIRNRSMTSSTSSSASRFADAFGFLTFTQCAEFGRRQLWPR
jgi:hypothetical protein